MYKWMLTVSNEQGTVLFLALFESYSSDKDEVIGQFLDEVSAINSEDRTLFPDKYYVVYSIELLERKSDKLYTY